MPSWKKVITSGSDAALNSLLVTTSVTASVFSGSHSGSLFGTSSWSQNAVTASYGINIQISGSVNNADYVQFNTAASVTSAVGRLYYDSGEGSLQLGLAGGNVIAGIGENLYQYVYNNTGGTLSKGQVVYISGSQGNRISVKLASNNAEQGSANTLGIAAENIGAGGEGWIQTEGVLRQLNTSTLTAGQLIYLGATPGTYTQTIPTAPSHSVRLGYAERIDATVGSIYIKIDNGYETDELHDVFLNALSSGDLFVRSGSVWINSKQLTGSYGLTGSLNVISGGITSSLFGTSSWSNNSISSSFASTASFVNTLNQNVLITGSLTIGASSIGANENTLVLGPSPAGGVGEGGQLLLQAQGGTYTSASMLDNYQNKLRFLRGTNAGSDAYKLQIDMHTGQFQAPNYNSLGAFSGTPVAALGVNSSGDIITIQTGSQAGGSGVTINNNTDNYILTATGTANTINGESNLQFNGSTLSVTGNVSATSITASGAILAQANGAAYFRGGDDAEFWDINVANTVGIYGLQDQTIASIKLGSGGGTVSGKAGNIGIGTLDPGATLHVQGNVSASSYTGSLFGTASYVTGSIFTGANRATSASYAVTASFLVGDLKMKAGNVANTSFGGSPRTASVAFTTAFPNTNYAVTVTGEDNRVWMIQSKTTAGFTINSNSTIALAGTTYWIATVYGES